MRSFVLLSNKPWHDKLFIRLKESIQGKWIRITSKEEFNSKKLEEIDPAMIFIPHWSDLIPESIFARFECVIFHMTDLPFGRGGSPLQNLITAGHSETKISAIRVEKGLDTGPIYLKESLSLLGTAEEIFIRASDIIGAMIAEILEKELVPESQKGIPTIFKRRSPEDGDISNLYDMKEIYDCIRMLDANGYPPAYVDLSNFKIEFSRASLKSNEIIIADVRIIKK